MHATTTTCWVPTGPTPTAAAEMAATARDELLQAVEHWARRLTHGVERQLDRLALGER